MSEEALVDAIFDVAFSGSDADVKARKDILWIAGITLLADVLGRVDEFSRERLLRGLEREIRDALKDISKIMQTVN